MAHNALCSMALLPEQVLYLEIIFFAHKTYPTRTEAEKNRKHRSQSVQGLLRCEYKYWSSTEVKG